MRLRYALILALLAGAAAAAFLAWDLNDRLLNPTPGSSSESLWAAVSGAYLTILGALACLNLAALLLLGLAFREERAAALLAAGQPITPAASALPVDDPTTPQDAAAPVPAQLPWGRVESWKEEHGPVLAELWARTSADLYGSGPKVAERFQKLWTSPEWDKESSAVALSPEGKFLGAVLALRQPVFEDDGYWWLESPAVIAALAVDPEQRRKGIGRALVGYVEVAARRRRRPRLFVGGLENFPHLVPGVPEQDQGARVFWISLGFREVRRTCHMEAEFQGYSVPADLQAREERLKGEGYSFARARIEDREAYQAFLERSTLERPTRRLEKFVADAERICFALKDGRIVGFIQVSPLNEQAQSGIQLIYFQREYRGVGLGSILLTKAHELWKAMGARSGSIWTYPEAAARFYPRAGFRTVQEWVCFEKELNQSWGDALYVNRWR